jgi:hypothetical protein
MALIIDEKSSFNNIISAESFATSLPDIPIAMPILAYFNELLSPAPSPVTNTIYPLLLAHFTIMNF